MLQVMEEDAREDERLGGRVQELLDEDSRLQGR